MRWVKVCLLLPPPPLLLLLLLLASREVDRRGGREEEKRGCDYNTASGFQLISSSYQPRNHNRSLTPLLASFPPSSLVSSR